MKTTVKLSSLVSLEICPKPTKQLVILASNSKLNFYNTFKTADTNRTEFLDAINNLFHRSASNKFRLGNHRLRVEIGTRYTVPKTIEHFRICSLCQANEVENECHVMFSCTLFDTLRNKFFVAIICIFSVFLILCYFLFI